MQESTKNNRKLPPWGRYLILILGSLIGLGLIISQLAAGNSTPAAPLTPSQTPLPPTATPTKTPEPLLPTVTPTPLTENVDEPTENVVEVGEPEIITPSQNEDDGAEKANLIPIIESDWFSRFGVSGQVYQVAPALEAGLPFLSMLTWKNHVDPPIPDDVVLWQMIRLKGNGVTQPWDQILEAVEANPGTTWVIGNEPDVIWQDNVVPELYAELYHESYEQIKGADPTAQIALAGVAEGTPLRLAYLDRVFDHYEATFGRKMPVDVFTIHGFVLREERGSWGVDIPPGFDDVDTGQLYEIEDHGSIALFEQNLVNFRAWMAERGYQNRPLALTEFSILFPADYGFDDAFMENYMAQTFEILMTLSNDTGLPSDDFRLIQTWFWYIIEDSPDYYPRSSLINSEAEILTTIGQMYSDYLTTPRIPTNE